MGQEERSNSLLTSRMRKYLTGEEPIDDDSYENKFKNRLGERVAHGLADLSLLTKHREQIDPLWLMMKKGTVNENGEYKVVRDGWRNRDVHNVIPELLTFIMDLSSTFNYGPRDWEIWLKRAFEAVHPDGYIQVNIQFSPHVDIDEAHKRYEQGEALSEPEIWALHDAGRIGDDELPDELRSVRQAFYTKPD